MQILIVGDQHVADHPMVSRIDDYKEAILAKLAKVADYAIQYEVDAVVLTGDMFHLKAPSRSSHSLVNRLIQVFFKMLINPFKLSP